MIPFQPAKLVMALAAVLPPFAAASAFAQEAASPAANAATPAGSVRDLSETRVSAKRLDAARNALSPDTGSSVYKFDTDDIARLPLGDATPSTRCCCRLRAWCRIRTASCTCAATTPTCSTASTA